MADSGHSNTAFSIQLPTLQLALDSTSLGEYKICPRRYQLSIGSGLAPGWAPRRDSVHLQFGIWLHGAREQYDHARASGAEHEEALRRAFRWAAVATWNKTLARPWASDHPTKNRLTLLRSIVWYLDTYGAEDPLATIRLANGRPAVELSFRFEIDRRAPTGEPYVLCGHLDRLADAGGGAIYVADIKTTGDSLSDYYFSRYTPDNQVSMYSLAGRVAFSTPVRGVIIDAMQVLAGGTRFARAPIPRTEAQLNEWLSDTNWWISQMEESAQRGHWPQNDKSCHLYGGCPFRPVCGRSPGAAREQWLQADYRKRVWDPLKVRGDI